MSKRLWALGGILLLAFLVMLIGCQPDVTPITPTETPAPPTPTAAAPAVVIAPSGGIPGTAVEAAISGLEPNASVELVVGREDEELEVVDTIEADAEGQLTRTVTIPERAQAAERWVVGVRTEGQPVAISNPFEVVAPDVEPSVDISPPVGEVGATVQVNATGFAPSTPVDIGFGRVDSEYDVLATTTTDAQGNVTAQIEVPDFADPASRWVFVVATQDRTVTAISDTFNVVATAAPSTPTPEVALFTEADIYLIIVGDAGEHGQYVGCDDSAVPVEVSFEPTVAPLTVALETLLSVDAGSYTYAGQPLDNALDGSDLTVAGITIEDGTATITLSGSLVIGGVCDAPRVEAQIEKTALQFDTVKAVEITLNGEPLEDYLSER